MSEPDGQWWTCRKCQQVLGVVRGPLLFLGLLVSVDAQIRVRCEHCRTYQTWYPSRSESQLGEVKTIGGA